MVADESIDKDTFGREEAFMAFERCWLRAAELGVLSWRWSRAVWDAMLKRGRWKDFDGSWQAVDGIGNFRI